MEKIKIDRKSFADTLSEVASYISKKPMVAITRYAKITTKDTRLKVEANSESAAITKYMGDVESESDGSFLIDPNEIYRYISMIKDDYITLTESEGTVTVYHSKGTAEFQVPDVKEFPSFKVPDSESKELNVPASFLAEAVNLAMPFCATEQIRPIMTAIYAYAKEGKIGYCASDTHKLIHGEHDLTVDQDVDWFIMPDVAKSLAKMPSDATIGIKVFDGHVQYKFGSTIIQSVTAKGKYPDFRRVIPRGLPIECSVLSDEMVNALSRIALLAPVSNCLKLSVSQMDMSMSVDNIDSMKKTTETITHDGCNDSIVIGLNISHLVTCLKTFKSANVLLKMQDPSRPVLICSHESDGVTALVMPMTLQS